MGKLLSGRYGSEPEAESIAISLRECNQKLGLKPTDFVSEGAPKFFETTFGATGKYLLFLTDVSDVKDSPIWKSGYYLLPLEAKDILKAIDKRKPDGAAGHRELPLEWDGDQDAPEEIKELALAWGKASQPLFFKCICEHLELKLYAPWALRTQWKVRLKCPRRCQPQMTTLLKDPRKD